MPILRGRINSSSYSRKQKKNLNQKLPVSINKLSIYDGLRTILNLES